MFEGALRGGCHVVADSKVRHFIIITKVRTERNATMPEPIKTLTDLSEAAKEKQNNSKLEAAGHLWK